MSKERYSPCFECLNRYGRQYSKECDEFCDYAHSIKLRDIVIKDLEKIVSNAESKLEEEKARTLKLSYNLDWAYQFICKLKE